MTDVEPSHWRAAALPSSPVSYGIAAKVVAAGFPTDARWDGRLRATLILSPTPEDTPGPRATLPRWPLDIDDALASGIDLLFAKPTAGAAEPEAEFVRLTARRTLRHDQTRLYDDTEREELAEFWQRLIAPDPRRRDSHGPWLPWYYLDRVLQQKSDPIPDVVGARRWESALISSLSRARLVMERLRLEAKNVRHAHRQQLLALADVDAPPRDGRYRPWLGGSPDIRVAALDPSIGLDGMLAHDVTEQVMRDEVARARQFRDRARAGSGPRPVSPSADAIARAIVGRDRPALQSVRDAIDGLYERVYRQAALPNGFASTYQVGKDDQQQMESARRRLFGATADPMTQRLFNFSVDVTIEMSDLEAWLPDLTAGGDHLVFVAAVPKGADPAGKRLRWSGVKLRHPGQSIREDAGVTGAFWPASRAEFLPASSPDEALHWEGSMKIGRDAHGDPRVQIVSLDVVGDLVARQAASLWSGTTAPAAGATGDNQIKLTQRTAGMNVVRCNLVAFENTVEDYDKVVFAENLTTGYRLDVATTLHDGRREWRSLHHRRQVLYDPFRPRSSWIKQVLGRVMMSPNDHVRMTAGSIRVNTRAVDPKDAEHVTANAVAKTDLVAMDDILATWYGDPLGIDCDEGHVFVPASSDFAIGREAAPLNSEDDAPGWLPPALRTGEAYHVATRVEYEGGVVIPLVESEARLAKRTDLTWPPLDERGWRLLRHERIDPPILALDATTALAHTGPHALDGASVAALRDYSGHEAARPYATKRALRVLLAPVVPIAFAAQQGVFDDADTVAQIQSDGSVLVRPEDGLVHVAFSALPEGGLPVLVVDPATGVSSLEERNATRRSSGPSEPRGDGLFDVRDDSGETAATRPLPYYPDPAARSMILAARRRTSDKQMLSGAPAVVQLYGDGNRHPNAIPVIVEIVSAPPRQPGSIVRQEDVFGKPQLRYFRDGRFFLRPPAQGVSVRVQRLEVRLAPGEDYDILAWCGTTTEWFRDCFELCESLASYNVQAGGGTDADQSCMAAWMGADPNLGKTVLQALSEFGDHPRPKACTTGGLPLPSEALMHAIAEATIKSHASCPVSELAAPRVFRAVHATAKPLTTPDFQQEPVVIRKNLRLADAKPEEALNTLIADHPVSGWSVDVKDDVDATDVLVGATINCDVETTHALDLICYTQQPFTDVFDDIRRKRPAGPPVAPAQSLDTYGFAVDAWGKVTLGTQRLSMMTVELEEKDDLVPIGPQDGQLLTDRSNVPRRRSQRHTFTDPLARSLALSLRAHPRFADFFKDRQGSLLGKGESEAEFLAVSGSVRTIIAPATVRPSRIEAKSVFPAFVWEMRRSQRVGSERETSVVSRTMLVRLRLQRPWFSSGIDEKLGIVLWPPNLFTLAPSDLATNVVPNPLTDQGQLPLDTSPAAMLNFSDDDLGPGGAFVTRWGSDPIRKTPTSDGWFMPREAFLDENGEHGGTLESVTMPVPAGDKPQEGTNAPPIPIKTLAVTLLTFEPRFDLDSETWYVDVPINPMSMAYPFVRLGIVRYQAHAHPTLQVSEPSTVEFQLMPKRTVEVETTSAASNQQVSVVMRGRGSIRSAPLPEDAEKGRRDAEPTKLQRRHRPTVKAMILRSVQGHPSAPVGEEIARDPAGAELLWDSSMILTDQPIEGEGGLVWRHRFELANDPTADGAGFALFLEEIEQMLPATYGTGEQPTAEKPTPARLESTGPKFAVRIALNFNQT